MAHGTNDGNNGRRFAVWRTSFLVDNLDELESDNNQDIAEEAFESGQDTRMQEIMIERHDR